MKMKMKMKKLLKKTSRIAGVATTILVSIFWGSTASAQVILDNGFEGGQGVDWSNEGNTVFWQRPANVSLVNDSREGNKSVRFLPNTSTRPESRFKRSEFTVNGGRAYGQGRFIWGEEYWNGFSLKINKEVEGFGIIYQHHSASAWGANGMAFKMKGDELNVYTATNSNKVFTVPTGSSALWGLEIAAQATIEYGKWHDFVIHFKTTTDDTGYIEVWMNGEKIVSKLNTPTMYLYDMNGEEKAPHNDLKFGMYNGRVENRKGEILFDAFRIGKGSSVTYSDVAPGGGCD